LNENNNVFVKRNKNQNENVLPTNTKPQAWKLD